MRSARMPRWDSIHTFACSCCGRQDVALSMGSDRPDLCVPCMGVALGLVEVTA